jgi:photosynthetic reaction center L subunit
MRQVDISRKLDMTYEVPISYGVVFSAWLTLQVFRPVLMGAWGEGFTLGILPHLDWVSNFGYRYGNFFYNPFHDIAISLFFASALVLCLHGGTILSAARKQDADVESIANFYFDLIGTGASEIGVHRISFWLAISATLFANLCIITSGPLVDNWVTFWDFWPNLPFWSGF